jgi:hypothetical protein
MSSIGQATSDGITLAATVRSLAERSHRVLTSARDGVGSDPHEIRALLQQISQSRRQVLDRRPDDLRRWLENLYVQVEALQSPPALRPYVPHRDRPHLSV